MIRRASEMTVEVRENMREGKGKVTIQHFFKKEEFGAKCRLCSRLTLPPGASIGTHPHNNEDELFIITNGTGLLEEGATKTPVHKGDAILTGKGASHAIANNGQETLEIIAIIMMY